LKNYFSARHKVKNKGIRNYSAKKVKKVLDKVFESKNGNAWIPEVIAQSQYFPIQV